MEGSGGRFAACEILPVGTASGAHVGEIGEYGVGAKGETRGGCIIEKCGVQAKGAGIRRQHAIAFRKGRYALIVGHRFPVVAILFGPKEKRLVLFGVVHPRDVERPAESSARFVLLVKRSAPGLIEEVAGIKHVIAQEEIGVAMKVGCAALGGSQDRAGSAAAVHRAVVGGENLQIVDGVDTGVDDQSAAAPIEAGVEDVTTIDIVRVVLNPAPVYAVFDAPFYAHQGFILASLVAHARCESYQLS